MLPATFTQPSLTSMTSIEQLVAHIAEHFDPDKIILFGSYAYGEPKEWSDVDLLVVKEVPPDTEIPTAIAILNSLPHRDFALDLLVRSPSWIERRIPLGDWFIRDITTQGRVLYERSRG